MGVALLALLLIGGAFGVVIGGTALAGELTRGDVLPGLVFFAGIIVAGLFAIWIGVGQMLFFLKVARGEPAGFSDLFAGGPFIATFLGATILFTLIVSVGMMFCYVPGIIFALMFSQCFYLIVDRQAGVVESLSLSKDITDGNKMTLFLIQLVVQLVANALLYATCGLGMLAMMPFMGVMNAVIYLAMTGQPTADRPAMSFPQPPGGAAVAP